MSLKNSGVIRHIGMSSHNPKVAMKAAQSGYVEMILFSINPAFDLLPASEDLDTMFVEEFDAGLKGTDADRARLLLPRQALHASELRMPCRGAELRVTAPLPADMRKLTEEAD